MALLRGLLPVIQVSDYRSGVSGIDLLKFIQSVLWAYRIFFLSALSANFVPFGAPRGVRKYN